MPEPKHNRFELLAGAGSLSIEAAGDADGKPSLPKIKILAYNGGVMDPYIGPSPMVIDLHGVTLASQNLPIRYAHDGSQDSGIGHTESVDIGAARITATGVVSRDTEAAREVVLSAKKGFPWQASIGGDIREYEFIREGQTAQANGKTFKGPVYLVSRAILKEISVCDLGADAKTRVSIAARRAAEGGKPMPEEPVSQTTETDGQQQAGDPQSYLQIRDFMFEAKATSDACRNIEAQAVKEAWSFERFEAAIRKQQLDELRASRGKAPAMSGGGRMLPTSMNPVHVIAACAALRAGFRRGALKRFGEEVCDAADQLRVTCDTDLAKSALMLSGLDVPIGGNDAIMRAAFNRRGFAAAGISTTTLPEGLALGGELALQEGFSAAPDTTFSWVGRVNVSDFKPQNRIRPYQKGGEYGKVPPGGEIHSIALDYELYTNKADTYGQLAYIDRQTVMNDKIGAVFEVQKENGRRAQQRKLREVYSLLLSNKDAFFSEAHANLLSGGDSALSVVSLAVAVRTFREQVDADGIPIGVVPVTLVTTPALEFTARQILRSASLERSQSVSDQQPTANPLQSIVNLEIEPMLASAAVHANASQTGWYIFGSPSNVPAVVLSLLNGAELPVIETVDMPPDILGVGFRSYFDFGADFADWRTGLLAAGA